MLCVWIRVGDKETESQCPSPPADPELVTVYRLSNIWCLWGVCSRWSKLAEWVWQMHSVRRCCKANKSIRPSRIEFRLFVFFFFLKLITIFYAQSKRTSYFSKEISVCVCMSACTRLAPKSVVWVCCKLLGRVEFPANTHTHLERYQVLKVNSEQIGAESWNSVRMWEESLSRPTSNAMACRSSSHGETRNECFHFPLGCNKDGTTRSRASPRYSLYPGPSGH